MMIVLVYNNKTSQESIYSKEYYSCIYFFKKV